MGKNRVSEMKHQRNEVRREKRSRDRLALEIAEGVLGIMMVISALVILSLTGGCSRRVYLPVESVSERIDTIHHREVILEHDTFTRIERVKESRLDSIAPILDSAGKMIGYDRWHIIDRSFWLEERNARLMAMIDSLREERIASDIVSEPYPVEVVREVNRLRWWQKGLMWIGAIGLAFLASAGIIIRARSIKSDK